MPQVWQVWGFVLGFGLYFFFFFLFGSSKLIWRCFKVSKEEWSWSSVAKAGY